MSQNGKLMPNLDQNSTKLLNLTVLQRIDPFVEQILITAAHVAFYEFNIDLSQWSRKDVEGSLFVVKRNAQPRFQFIVMNRRNTDNLVENLLGDFEFEVQVPYLLYRNSAQEVSGIWFYNAQECEEVANLFNRILNAYSKVPPVQKVSSAKSEYEELEPTPTMAAVDGPLEPPSSTTSNNAEVPDDNSFVNFFSNALSMGNAPNPPMAGQHYQPSQANLPPYHLSNPAQNPHPSQQVPSAPMNLPRPVMPLRDNSDRGVNSNRATNLVMPSTFFSPASSSSLMAPSIASSMPTAPPNLPPVSLQRHYGAPLLQPFPPPTPPPSLTPTSTALGPNYGPVINRDKVREAVLNLVQDNQFIDMVYQALQNAHHT
ncbi:hypothetical protein QQ045_024654 [Rhodiola kirilowii]